jgi:hypothetical protein
LAKRRNVSRDVQHPITDTGSTELTPGAEVTVRTAEDRALDFAEDLGRLLGTAQQKATAWLDQRQEAVKTLTNLRDTANQLLERLQAGASAAASKRRGRRRVATTDTTAANARVSQPSGKRKRNFKMSAAQKKAVGDRMRKYWAQRRKAEGRQ